ncbi:hypothetical protein AVEN_201461-1 [Araneus ventricosus]|uniref:Uncharacterized protein n=1 Tax=Araneus ventricosus TaxID=182803 RepID=A0A4Y2QH54_ARAVE|nr:hypothetical protein AVEN_201461-1 [Araneus ventricosus]
MRETGETKLKLEAEGEGIGKGNERNELLNFNDTEAVNVHITLVKCGKILVPHINGANQLVCRLASSPDRFPIGTESDSMKQPIPCLRVFNRRAHGFSSHNGTGKKAMNRRL